MKHTIAATGAVLLLTACGRRGGVTTTTITHRPTAAAADTTTDTSTDTTTETAAAPAPAPAHIGDTIRLKGNNDGEQLDITLVRVAVRPAATSPDIDTPKPGDRYYAAQFRIVNTGTASYEDAPSNGAKVGDAQGEQFDTAITEGINTGPLLPNQVKLAPGGTVLGWMVFDVPNSTVISQAQFGLNSGFGGTGQWMIP